LTGGALVALAALILWHIQGFPAMPGQKFGPAWFPGVIAGGLGFCGVLLVTAGVRQTGPWLALPPWVQRRRSLLGVVSVIAGLLFYIFAADKLGFHLTGIMLMTAWLRILGCSWRVAILVGVVATVAIHLAFYKLLRIPLPWGVFEQYAF
jgi:putative tricarboxylic transport membrane protein